MSDALKASVLDLKTVRPYIKILPLLFLVGVVMDVVGKSGTFVIAYAALITITSASYPFGAEEKSRLHFLALSLPVSRRSIVAGRYIQVILTAFFMAAVAFVLSIISAQISGIPISPSERISAALLSCACALLFIFIQYPFYYRLGYMRARYIVSIPVFLIVMILPQIKPLQNSIRNGALSRMIHTLSTQPLLAVAALFALCALVGFLSFLLSYRFFKNKDL